MATVSSLKQASYLDLKEPPSMTNHHKRILVAKDLQEMENFFGGTNGDLKATISRYLKYYW